MFGNDDRIIKYNYKTNNKTKKKKMKSNNINIINTTYLKKYQKKFPISKLKKINK